MRLIPLVELELPEISTGIPHDVREFLREADRRIDEFWRDFRIPAFVPCDFVRAYEVLGALSTGHIATGNQFCEWGSGFGVVTCLAAMLDFDACGIEIERDLVDAARQLAEDFELPVEFTHGSFIPPGSEECLTAATEFAWLVTDASGGSDEPALSPDCFDVIFAFPWPDEEHVLASLFEEHAATGTVLVTYHGVEDLRVRRKTASRRRRAYAEGGRGRR